jgi:hypothetical protein
MNQEHGPWDVRNYFKGAKTSVDQELVGAQNDGYYLDSRNARPVSADGHTGDLKRIKGEVMLYAANVSGSYACMGTISVNQHIVEFWASAVPGEYPYVRVDGLVCLYSVNFTLNILFPLQLDRNEDINGGEVFITDMNSPPIIFNVGDLISARTLFPSRYFSAFNVALYQVNLTSPLDIPVFVELSNVGGGGGLPVGSYSYKMRYVSVSGDRTNMSQSTPLIPVMENLSSSSNPYPYSKTYGLTPSPTINTRYAIHLRFRVTNIFNYDYIEIIRIAFNSGAGIGYTPQEVVVAKLPIGLGEISVRDFLDPVESDTNLVLSDTDESQELNHVEWAKSIRYFDRRTILMNVKLASKDSAITFNQIDGQVAFPLVENLFTGGYGDPYNYTYKKKYINGERYGFGIELYDGVGGKGFVTKIPQGFDNYMFPNRRYSTTAQTDLYAYWGTVRAANFQNGIGNTYEVVDHYVAGPKTDKCSFKNIYRRENLGLYGWKSKTNINTECSESDGDIENHGARVELSTKVFPFYHPYTPVRQDDTNVDGHNYMVNPNVNDGSNPGIYTPYGFALQYYALGLMIAGIDNFPAWAKAFSVVRTAPAKRVLAQGIGMYALIPAVYDLIGNSKLCTKETNKFWFFSPDIENGIVASSLINDIVDAPEDYQVQFVAPFGFFSEVYSFENNVIVSQRDRLIDMICYARIERDNALHPYINVFEDPAMGYYGGDFFNYVGYGKWRNRGQQPGIFNGPNRGDILLDIAKVDRISEGRGNYFAIETVQTFYGTNSTGGNSHRDFNDTGMQDFTEPWYIVNIVQDGAIIRNQNIQTYKSTGHYQKLTSIIGQGDGTSTQKYILVDERWEDCISAPYVGHPTATTDRYIYIQRVNTNVVEKWMNLTYKTPSQVNTILTAINNFGVYGPGVTGVYSHNNINGQSRFWEIVFNYIGFYPQQGDLILVKYDNTAPIRVFGGDAIVGETLFAPIDRQADAYDTASDTQFALGIGFPYRQFQLNPRHYVIKNTGGLLRIQDTDWMYLGYIRQMCVMFTCESRAVTPYAYCLDYPLQYFPAVNYVMRPNRWDSTQIIVNQNIYPNYVDDYGANEISFWKYGGFRFTQNINPDYSSIPPNEYVSKPEFGFVEKTVFATGIMWSLARAINVQDAPGLKTFPANNRFDIDDSQGEIKRAYDCMTGQHGENLYAFTNSGVCMLVTKKSILSDLTAGQLGYMSASTFIQNQYWLTKHIGMRNELWRSATEGFIPMTDASGAETRMKALMFANDESVFVFSENTVRDIGRIGYFDQIKPTLANVQAGFASKVTSAYDNLNQEYWLNIQNPGFGARTFVFGLTNKEWHGQNDFNYDQYCSVGDRTFGMRAGNTFELGIGDVINGTTAVFEGTQVCAKDQMWTKEFIRFRVNTADEVKPTRVEFYDKLNGTLLCFLDPGQGPLYLKKYLGYEQFVPRKQVSVSPTRDRVQGRALVYKIIYNLPGEFVLVDSAIQYKRLK